MNFNSKSLLEKRVNGDQNIAMFRMVWSFFLGWSLPQNCGPLMSLWHLIHKNYVIFFRQANFTLLPIAPVVVTS